LSRRLGDDPLARKRGSADAFVQVATVNSSSYNKVFFQTREQVDARPSEVMIDVIAPATVAAPAEPATMVEQPPTVAPPAATPELTVLPIENDAQPSPIPEPSEAAAESATAGQVERPPEEGGFLKRLFERLQG